MLLPLYPQQWGNGHNPSALHYAHDRILLSWRRNEILVDGTRRYLCSSPLDQRDHTVSSLSCASYVQILGWDDTAWMHHRKDTIKRRPCWGTREENSKTKWYERENGRRGGSKCRGEDDIGRMGRKEQIIKLWENIIRYYITSYLPKITRVCLLVLRQLDKTSYEWREKLT